MWQNLVYQLKRPYHWFKTGVLAGLPAEFKYGFPARKLKIVTITGTDGKTTSSTLLYTVLKEAGYRVALLSTVAAYVGDETYDTGFHVTSPNPADLHRFLRLMVDKGIEYLVLEATSHGAYQYRTWGIHPVVAGLTNIAHEHLDYHLNYQNYVDAKLLLLKQAKAAVINADDQSAPRVKKALKSSSTRIIEYSLGMSLPKVIRQAINQRFPEAYNQANARLVTCCALELGVSPQAIATGLLAFHSVPGRMQAIPSQTGVEVVVDFAHTPQGLEAALLALKHRLRKQKGRGQLIAVFGSAGLRDHTKRPMMGEIAGRLADQVVLTAEDPRTEDVWSIINQIKSGLTNSPAKIMTVVDRQQAIEFAIGTLAKPGDIVGIFGKGHEQSMCFGTTEYPWSDVTAAEQALAQIPRVSTARRAAKR